MARRKRRHHHRESSGGGRVLITALVSLVVLVVGAMVAAWWWLDSEAEPFAADRAETAQTADVALVLGAAPFLADGKPNRFFEYRLDAAADLFRAGKVKYLLASGDSVSDPHYDETTAMKRGLVKRGVPAEAIYRDTAGVRTLDSVLRARDLYGQRRMVIVSQDFHVRRAVWLAREHGIEAFGLDAQGVSPFDALDSWARQFPSALKAVLDIWTGSVARYRGKPVRIGVDPAD
ncbi:MAG: YdcF family protein [Alphaproteobacteria bacterium]|nr:YdcF family protein [Alphaproteobacteria bacterium]MCW5742959.1 YdcF family protein [Alphaproteobacteria bacterium]